MSDIFGSLAPDATPVTSDPNVLAALAQEIIRRNATGAPTEMPSLRVNSEHFSVPNISGSYSTPFLGGSIGMLGNYQRNPFNPNASDWSARMMYRRPF